jgi:heat shock protein HslJ
MKHTIGLTILIILALALSACGAQGDSGGLTGVSWEWTAMQETVPASQSVVPPDQIGKYAIVFNDDNAVTITADCNTGSGSYTGDGDSLDITLGAMTLAFCGEASLDTIYLASLDKVSSYAIEGGGLQLKFPDDGGKMDFQNGGATQ